MSKQTYFIDASSLKYSSCLRRFHWKIIEGYSTRGDDTNYKAGYGTCFHHCMADVFRGMPIKDAIAKAVAEYADRWEKYAPETSKTECRFAWHLELVLKSYFKSYNNSPGFNPLRNPDDNSPFVEIKFQWPYHSNDSFDIVLAGTIDLVTEYAGYHCVTDHKVTGSYQVAKFMEKFDLDIQPLMYVWMYKQMTGRILPFLCNGVFIKKATQKAMEAGQFDGVTFQRSSIIQYTPEQVDTFEQWLARKLATIITSINNNTGASQFDYSCCHANPLEACAFVHTCKLTPDLFDTSLKSNFVKQQYEPLKFQE
jgi:hypothetical protein